MILACFGFFGINPGVKAHDLKTILITNHGSETPKRGGKYGFNLSFLDDK
jgi:hypothetical protein